MDKSNYSQAKARRVENVVQLVKTIERERINNPVTLIDRVSQESGISREKLLGQRRNAIVALNRHAIYYLLRIQGYSYQDIADLTNREDHTTILHGVDVIEEYLEQYKED